MLLVTFAFLILLSFVTCLCNINPSCHQRIDTLYHQTENASSTTCDISFTCARNVPCDATDGICMCTYVYA